jgi:hypothetical protein
MKKDTTCCIYGGVTKTTKEVIECYTRKQQHVNLEIVNC